MIKIYYKGKPMIDSFMLGFILSMTPAWQWRSGQSNKTRKRNAIRSSEMTQRVKTLVAW